MEGEMQKRELLQILERYKPAAEFFWDRLEKAVEERDGARVKFFTDVLANLERLSSLIGELDGILEQLNSVGDQLSEEERKAFSELVSGGAETAPGNILRPRFARR